MVIVVLGIFALINSLILVVYINGALIVSRALPETLKSEEL